MSVWADIRKRGNGSEIKKEDVVEEKNLWHDISWEKEINKKIITQLMNDNIKLQKDLDYLKKELDSFRWNKSQIKCNYKI